ncbi:MAG: hypothetical protein GX022_01440 [Clostridiaceae bacterium]|nr:hypothetical protein [Clostridiaceae bacterium]
MLIENEHTQDPVQFNNLFQAQSGYPGVDNLEPVTLPKGTIIAALSGPKKNMVGYYFIHYEEVLKHGPNSIELCQGAQVKPFFRKNSGISPQYKTNIRFYVLNEDIKVAEGDTTENPHWGTGGFKQLVIPNAKEMIIEAIEDKDIFNPNHSIIPVNLNTFESDSRFSGKTKDELQRIVETLGKENISPADGSIILKNCEITEPVYNLLDLRARIHENTMKYNCLMKEYTDELKKEEKDLLSIKSLREDINNTAKDLSRLKMQFKKTCIIIKQDPELTKGFSEKHKSHLFDVNTCCPQIAYELKHYLEKKAEHLEYTLNSNVRQDIPERTKADFIENMQLEVRANRMYDYYSAVDNYGIIQRKLVFAPHYLVQAQQRLKENLFISLKCKDDLLTINTARDEKVREFCSRQIIELDKYIEKFQNAVMESEELIGNMSDQTLNAQIQYLRNKTQPQIGEKVIIDRLTAVDREMEININKTNAEILDRIGTVLKHTQDYSGLCGIINQRDFINSISEMNRFCEITDEINKVSIEMRSAGSILNRANLANRLSLLNKRQADIMKSGGINRIKVISIKKNIGIER